MCKNWQVNFVFWGPKTQQCMQSGELYRWTLQKTCHGIRWLLADLYYASIIRISHEAWKPIPLAGEEYLVLDKPLSALTNQLKTSSGARVLTQWPVVSIDYSKPVIKVRSQHGRTVHCTHIIITVPLKMLQQEDIHFIPQTPALKTGCHR